MQQGAQFFGVHARRQSRGAHQIAKHHRELAALTGRFDSRGRRLGLRLGGRSRWCGFSLEIESGESLEELLSMSKREAQLSEIGVR